MKTIKMFAVVLVLFFATTTLAQVSVSVRIGTPPLWGPFGYPAVQYYYLPDVEAYYDVRNSRFIYYAGGVWLHRKYLPAQHKNYDLYQGYKVVLTNYHGSSPYIYFKQHKMKYGKGYRGPHQPTIGKKPKGGDHGEKKYRNGSHDKGNNKEQGKGHGNGKGKK